MNRLAERPVEFNQGEIAAYVAARIPQLVRRGRKFRGPCPVHQGERDSFSLNAETGVAKCHSTCGKGWNLLTLEQEMGSHPDTRSAAQAVREIVGRPSAAQPASDGGPAWAPRPRALAPVVAEYLYRDQAGTPVMRVTRHQVAGGKKTYLQWRPDGNGGWSAGLTDPRTKELLIPLVPYRLPELLAAGVGEPVFVVEGEKCAEALVSLDFVATTNPMGAEKWPRPTISGAAGYRAGLAEGFSEYFRGREVIIIPDNDKPGEAHALQVATALAPVAEVIRVLRLPGLATKGDVADWIEAGGDSDQLFGLLAETPKWTPPADQPEAVQGEAEETETAEILPAAPDRIRRPLCLAAGHGYAVTWLAVRRERTREGSKTSSISPEERVVVRDDGKLFSDAPLEGASPIAALGLDVLPSDVPPASRLWTGAGVKRYQAGHRPDPVTVFREVVRVVDHFVDFARSLADQRTMTQLTGCVVLATYFLDAFCVAPYVRSGGEKGSGKSRFLDTLAELAYLGEVVLAGGSFAAIRDLAEYGAFLAFDDAEDLMGKKADPDKRTLLLAGNRRGATVPVKEATGKRGWVTRRVDAFTSRAFSAINVPDEVLGSRTITIPLVRSDDEERAKANPRDPDTWPCPRRPIVDDLWAVALANLSDLKRYDGIAAKRARLIGRDLEPWRPILAVALWLQDRGEEALYDRLEELSVAYQAEREDFELPDATRLLVRALAEMYPASSLPVMAFETAAICEQVNRLAEQEGITEYGQDFINPKRLGWVLKRLRLKKAPGTATRRWEVSRETLDSLLRTNGMLIRG